MIFTFCSDLARRFGVSRLVQKLAFGFDWLIRSVPSIQRATLYRGRPNWLVPDPFYGTYGIFYCFIITVCVYSAYCDTLACYIQGRPHYAGAVAYEPCDLFGISAPEFQVCKNARSRLFFMQMLSLALAIIPAYVLPNAP
jgi:hypothetical protein